jgi:hypothetical protein
MRFYSNTECEEWLSGRNRVKPNATHNSAALCLAYPKNQSLAYWAHWIATSLTYQQPCLLWITDWGIFSSSENWHLYYRVRQSYHDLRTLDEAPGHLFLNYETEDLATFLQIAMQNCWDGYVLTGLDYVNVFFSHDGFVHFYSDDTSIVDDIKKSLSEGNAPEGRS